MKLSETSLDLSDHHLHDGVHVLMESNDKFVLVPLIDVQEGLLQVLGAFRSQPHSLSEEDAFSGEDRFAFLLPAAGIAPLGGQQCFLV